MTDRPDTGPPHGDTSGPTGPASSDGSPIPPPTGATPGASPGTPHAGGVGGGAGAGGAPGGSAPPPPGGSGSAGKKILIGCAVFAVVATFLVVAVVGAGVVFFGQNMRDFTGGVRAQVEATELAGELETRHAFTPPESGEVTDDQAERFLQVTDHAWRRVEPWFQELEQRGARLEEDESIRSLASALSGVMGLGRVRVDFIDVLEEQQMSVSEYLWTGTTLMMAYEARNREEPGVPEANRALARRLESRLAALEADDPMQGGKGALLALGWTFGVADHLSARMREWEEMQARQSPPNP
jgi:hypothetical protein